MTVSITSTPSPSERVPTRYRYLFIIILVALAVVLAGRPLFHQMLARPLLAAVSTQNSDAVARLLHQGASANAIDEDGRPALMVALSNSNNDTPGKLAQRERIVDLLLKAGADPNKLPLDQSNLYSTSTGEPNIFLAIEARSVPILRDLLAHGADPNATSSQSPALIHAIVADSVRRVSAKGASSQLTLALLTAGADARVHRPYVKGARGYIGWADFPSVYLEELPLLVAVRYADKDRGNTVLTEALLAHGVIINARDHAGQTALSLAAAKGDATDVRVLLAHGAEPRLTDREGHTALQTAQTVLTARTVALTHPPPLSKGRLGNVGMAGAGAPGYGFPGGTGYPKELAVDEPMGLGPVSPGGVPKSGTGQTLPKRANGAVFPSFSTAPPVKVATGPALEEQRRVRLRQELTDLNTRYGTVEKLLKAAITRQ